MGQSHREAAKRLYEIADNQQGYFTAKQAKSAGFAENTHPYHVQVGNWVREYRGIYRLEMYPWTERPDLMLWALWSRNRNDEIQGVYSHDTALGSIYELSDLNPAKLHMTVPKNFRRSAEIPGILRLHYGELPEADIREAQGYKYTKPMRTILDVIEAGTVEKYIMWQAVVQALERGLITRQQLEETPMSEAARKTIEYAMRMAA